METRLAEKESQNSWPVLSSPTGTQLYLVTYLLWTSSTLIRINRNCGDVGVDRDDNEEIPSTIEIGILPACPISIVGQLCHSAQRGDCNTELIKKVLYCLKHHLAFRIIYRQWELVFQE